MTKTNRIAGVDGCRGGWIVAKADAWPPTRPPGLTIVETFETVLQLTEDCSTVAVDMPIGLAAGEPADSGIRQCDLDAKALLGRAASRVFMAPPRPALEAATYDEFNRLHRRLTGKGASRQLWGIVPKISEVDRSLTPETGGRVVEFHPELTWMRLAGRVLESKHSATGIIERLRILGGFGINVGTLGIDDLSDARAKADITDALDALVGLGVSTGAQRVPAGGAARTDRNGRMIEIWY